MYSKWVGAMRCMRGNHIIMLCLVTLTHSKARQSSLLQCLEIVMVSRLITYTSKGLKRWIEANITMRHFSVTIIHVDYIC